LAAKRRKSAKFQCKNLQLARKLVKKKIQLATSQREKNFQKTLTNACQGFIFVLFKKDWQS
jgi:hypothetical protein